MAKRRNNEWMGKSVEEIDEPIPIYEEEPETVRIMHMRDVILNYTGKVTGKLYHFNRGGSILDVDKKDAEIMLMRTEQYSCCGSVSTPQFEIVKE